MRETSILDNWTKVIQAHARVCKENKQEELEKTTAICILKYFVMFLSFKGCKPRMGTNWDEVYINDSS